MFSKGFVVWNIQFGHCCDTKQGLFVLDNCSYGQCTGGSSGSKTTENVFVKPRLQTTIALELGSLESF